MERRARLSALKPPSHQLYTVTLILSSRSVSRSMALISLEAKGESGMRLRTFSLDVYSYTCATLYRCAEFFNLVDFGVFGGLLDLASFRGLPPRH